MTVSSGRPRATRAPHASSSSRDIALSRLIIASACTTGANKRVRGAADVAGQRVVELDVGVVGGELAQLADQRVEVAVGDLGVVEGVVAVVVVADELGQLDEAQSAGSATGAVSHGRSPLRRDSSMRRPISRVTRHTRSATTGVCEPSPQCGVTRRWSHAAGRGRHRAAPARPTAR